MAICNHIRRSSGSTACFLLAASIIGCGQQDWGYVNGTVTVDGQPVGPGTITLHRVDAEGAGAIAFFGEDGKYTVMSSGQKEGAPIGEYRVAIEGGGADQFGVETVGPPPESPIPPRYSNPQTSDLTVTIEPTTKTVDFQLKS